MAWIRCCGRSKTPSNVYYDNGTSNPDYLPFHEWNAQGTSTLTYGADYITLTCTASVTQARLYTLQKIDVTDLDAIVLEYDFTNALTDTIFFRLALTSSWDTNTFVRSANNTAPQTAGIHAYTLNVSDLSGEYYICIGADRGGAQDASGKILSLRAV